MHDPIAEQVGAGVVAGPHQAGGQDERRREVGRPITRLDLVHRAMQRVAVPGDRGQDSGGGPHSNDGHPVRRPELVDDGIDLTLRLTESRRCDVRGLHRRGRVEQDDAVSGERGSRRQHRLHGSRDQGGRREQLQEEQPAGAQALPGHIGLAISDLVGPEVQGRHDPGWPANFQKVQRDDRGNRQCQGGRRRREKRHPSSPRRRSVPCTIASIAVSVDNRANRRPRRTAARSIWAVRCASAFT